jgi:hypothetical protein
MRLSRRTRLSLVGLSTLAACALPRPALAGGALLPPALAVAYPAGQQATCAAPAGGSFPLATSIKGGPDRYEPGGAARTWFIDLKNTTGQVCGAIHPVLVLVDTKRVLTVTQPELEFFDGDRPHRVTFRRTDRAELVGVFDDGFPGFSIAPGRTLTVKVRLAIGSGTGANDVVANAAIVQRHGNDGDWVGESNDYRFRIVGAAGAGTNPPRKTPSPTAGRSPGAEELASTGPRQGHGLRGVLKGLLLMAGGVIVAGLPILLFRRRR